MSIPIRSDKTCWIGLAHVRPRRGNNILQGAIGAFVPILALAKNQDDFISTAMAFLVEYGLEVIEIDDIQTFNERCKTSRVEEEIMELAANLSDDAPVVIDTFQAYDKE